MPRIAYGLATDVGMVRKHNEDAALAVILSRATSTGRDEIGLFAVADGWGGEQAGEMAVQLAVDKLTNVITEALMIRLDDGLESSATDWAGILNEGFQRANRAILDLGASDKDMRGASATMTAALVIGRDVHVAHVGDTGIFLVSRTSKDNVLQQLTIVHNLVYRLLELGQFTWEEIGKHPVPNVLYRAIGQAEDLVVDMCSFCPLPDSEIVLCSDGLTRYWNGWKDMSNDESHKIIVGASSPQQACNQLVVLANERGGEDNIAVVVVKVEDANQGVGLQTTF